MFSKLRRRISVWLPMRKVSWVVGWVLSRPFSVSRGRIARDIEAAIAEGITRREAENG